MNLATNKMIALMIIIIIIVLSVILLTGNIQDLIEGITTENTLRQCCGKYKANGCNNKEIFCNGETVKNLADKLNFDDNQLKEFCDCP